MKNRVVVIAALVLAFLAVGLSDASAQSFNTFMLVPGIPGDATEAQHVNWIEIESLSQGVSTAVKKSVACSDVHVTKVLDRAGPLLWAAAALGQVFPQVRIEMTRVVNEMPAVIYDVRLNNARVTSIQTSGGGSLPNESVAFSFQSLVIKFNEQSPTGVIIPGVPQTITCSQ